MSEHATLKLKSAPKTRRGVENGISVRLRSKEWIEVVQGVATTLAIVAGAWWFLRQDLAKPRIRLDQTVSFRPIMGAAQGRLAVVDVRVSNIGSVGVHLAKGTIRIGQINPIPGRDLASADLKELWLEPGESDQAFFKSYNVLNDVKTLEVVSRYAVPNKPLVWQLVSAADVDTVEQKNSSTAAPGEGSK